MSLSECANPWSWTLEGVDAPWGERPSLFRHVVSHIRPGEPGLARGGENLPDGVPEPEGGQLRWAPGALDGVFGHHTEGNDPDETAHEVLEALRALTRKATAERAAALYGLLADSTAIEYVDHLLSAVLGDDRLPPDRIREVARWIATGAPDREAVKIAIALLGLFRGELDRDLLLTLGRHEEFTLYAAVALGNSGEQPMRILWELARGVQGWGRIQTVERLAGTDDPEIKAWLLREGYRNSVLYEYTALTCAVTGNLVGALRCPEPDEALLSGAGEILATLIRGREGPAEGIGEYEDGSEAAELYLRHIHRRRLLGIEHLLATCAIEQLLEEDEGEAQDPDLGWPERCETLMDLAGAILDRPEWPEVIQSGLASRDPQLFHQAAEAAGVLGMDVWDLYFERLERGEDLWHLALQTDDPERIDRVLALAEELLPPDRTDPAGEPDALDFVLQDLQRFPGQGWPLLRAGLQSPVVRHRNQAARTLAAWGRPAWPPEAEFLLRSVLAHEPDEETRENLGKVVAGEPLEE